MPIPPPAPLRSPSTQLSGTSSPVKKKPEKEKEPQKEKEPTLRARFEVEFKESGHCRQCFLEREDFCIFFIFFLFSPLHLEDNEEQA